MKTLTKVKTQLKRKGSLGRRLTIYVGLYCRISIFHIIYFYFWLSDQNTMNSLVSVVLGKKCSDKKKPLKITKLFGIV